MASREIVQNSEAEEEYHQEMNLSHRLRIVTRKLNEIKVLLQDDGNTDLVEREFVELNDRLKKFKSAVKKQLAKSILDQPERLKLENWYTEKLAIMESSRRGVSVWIERIQTQGLDALDSASRAGSCVSRTSSRSSALSIKLKVLSQERINLAKEKAKLVAQEEFDQEMEAVEEQRALVERRAKAAKRKLERTKLAKVEEALNEYKEAVDVSGSHCSSRSRKTPPKERTIPKNQDKINLLADMVQRSHLPESEVRARDLRPI